jgi:RsiW-degrading membrane proteinase PrsW (M82 family)
MNDCPSCNAPVVDGSIRCGVCGVSLRAGDGIGGLGALAAAAASGQAIFESRIFLFLCFLGLSPLIVATLPSSRLVIDALSIWTGLCWGILLFRLFAPPTLSLKAALLVLLATSFLVMPLFELFLGLLPKSFDSWLESENLIQRLSGFIVSVGIREELFKSVPVIVALWAAPKLRRPRAGVVLGMMAGVGFASSENVFYVYSTLSEAIGAAKNADVSALVMPVYNNMVRTMVGPFAHAAFSGLLGSFIGEAFSRRALSPLFSGLVAAATLHGLYNTVVGYSAPLGAATLGLCLFLTMVVHVGVQNGEPLASSGEGLFSRTILRTSPTPLAAASPRAPRLPAGQWFVATSDGIKITVPVDSPLLIGRDSSICPLVVSDPSVSRIHARLHLVAGQPRVSRESRVGVLLVNGSPVDTVVLRPNDEIRIADTAFRIIRRDTA